MMATDSDGRQDDGDEDGDEATESDGGGANNGGKALPM